MPCSAASSSVAIAERFRVEFERIAAVVDPLASTPVYGVLVSAFMARSAVLFKLQSKLYQDMLSRGELSYMGTVSRIADFRSTVRPRVVWGFVGCGWDWRVCGLV